MSKFNVSLVKTSWDDLGRRSEIFAAQGPCEECPAEAYGTSRTHARKNMKAECRECRSNI